MAQKNVVVVRFTEPSKAYQALSALKECEAGGRIGLESAAIVERTPSGELPIPDGTDNVGLVGSASTTAGSNLPARGCVIAPEMQLRHLHRRLKQFREDLVRRGLAA